MRHIIFSVFLLALLCGAFPVYAQTETVATPTETEKPADDYDIRMELSKEYHQLRPVKPVIDSTIEKYAQISLPSEQQKGFVASIKRMVNYGAIQHFSIKTAADIFTAQELQAMIDYYSSPAARSAEAKMDQYQDKIAPEIIKMLDSALMEMRTGRKGN